MKSPARIASIEALVYRQPIEVPVVTSFGTMRDRPALFVRVTDSDGLVGLGEVWCNFPSVGPEHRARLIEHVLAPMVIGQDASHPAAVFESSTERCAVLAIQCGEPGPFAQAIAGIDLALWDLAARRAGQPLWRFLGGTSPTVQVYASGINPDRPEAMVERKRDEGHRRFKLKVGFGRERDLANLGRVRDVIGPDAALCVDANQGWSLEQALEMVDAMAPFDLRWLEEPLRADRPWTEWLQLGAATDIALAAGENLSSTAAFDLALSAGAIDVVQPDAAKWGGISGCLPVARDVIAAGKTYCPHYLGGGIGLLASAHLLAAVGGNGWLEIDSNPNPLRDDWCGAVGLIVDGQVTLSEEPGIGIVPELARLEPIRSR
ncbi:MAG: Mandelate racemase/muconate lactonizing protein [Rhizobacter sp.]|nr:Mandelate racemase/muconate lactonizing protein [Rhizobacter sp.]